MKAFFPPLGRSIPHYVVHCQLCLPPPLILLRLILRSTRLGHNPGMTFLPFSANFFSEGLNSEQLSENSLAFRNVQNVYVPV